MRHFLSQLALALGVVGVFTLGCLAATQALAQVAPSAAEAAKYTGLHAAAQRGDVTQIQRLATKPDALNATDAYGRTPLHVATFAKQREAIRALAKTGADLNRLENDRYDAVTIASVADDEETLRVLLQLGASAKQTTSRYDGTALIAQRIWATTASCVSSSKRARR